MVPGICISSSLCDDILGLASVMPYHCVTAHLNFLDNSSVCRWFRGAAALIMQRTEE